MNWIKYTPEDDCEMPEMELNSPATETVWICTDNPYADRYGTGHYDYETPGWTYHGCAPGFRVICWAKIEPPEIHART